MMRDKRERRETGVTRLAGAHGYDDATDARLEYEIQEDIVAMEFVEDGDSTNQEGRRDYHKALAQKQAWKLVVLSIWREDQVLDRFDVVRQVVKITHSNHAHLESFVHEQQQTGKNQQRKLHKGTSKFRHIRVDANSEDYDHQRNQIQENGDHIRGLRVDVLLAHCRSIRLT